MHMRFGLFIIPQGGDDTDLVDFPGHVLSSLRSRWGMGWGKKREGEVGWGCKY